MTTGSCTNDLLAADGGVVDQCGSVDVVDRALAGLVVAGEAPGVDLAVGGDGEVVIGTGGDGDDVLGFCDLLALLPDDIWDTELTRLDGRLEEDTGVASLVVDGVLLRQLVKLETDLVTVNTSPCQEVTLVRAS